MAAESDTSHRVQIDVNAPRGTRAAIVEGRGPATAGLRVRYSMETPT